MRGDDIDGDGVTRRGVPDAGMTRRAVVAGTGAAVVSMALGACEVYGGSSDQAEPVAPETGAGTAAGGATVLARTADVPVGGGRILKDQRMVVTQPTAGTFKGFTSVCTHQGCDVSSVEGGTINCACHGSKFAIADGSVAGGPAPKPLAPKNVRVDGDSILLA
jgi:Rieske Fe-S protein